jgi:outer membrane lipoprotein SlyB
MRDDIQPTDSGSPGPDDEHDAEGVREAVAVFHAAGDLEAAVDKLLSCGFNRAEISLLASEQAVEAKLGHRYRRVAALEDDRQVPRAAYVSREAIGDAEGALIGGLTYVGATIAAGAVVASGGTLAAVIAAATLSAGAGGLIGAAMAKLVGHRHQQHLQEQLDRGGLLLWVRTWDARDEARAVAILRRHAGEDVHLHGSSMAT